MERKGGREGEEGGEMCECDNCGTLDIVSLPKSLLINQLHVYKSNVSYAVEGRRMNYMYMYSFRVLRLGAGYKF